MILIFSDIHANKESAKFIERIAKGFEEVICCGDICGYGKDFKYCLDMFREVGVLSVFGNHDYMVFNNKLDLRDIINCVSDPIKWTRKHISKGDLEYLHSLPMQMETPSGIFVTHTYGLDYYVTNNDECKPLLKLTDAKIIAIGHTHIMKEHKIGDRTVINCGSISHGIKDNPRSYIIVDGDRIMKREYEGSD
jgi:putative phosphoesterase